LVRLLWLALALSVSFVSSTASAAPRRGEGLQTDGISVSLVNRDFDDQKTTTIRRVFNLSEIVGFHYYVADRVRLGLSLQMTERVTPEPEPGSSRLQRVAFLPQVGWNFRDPLYAGLAVSYAPRTRGRPIPDVALMPILGISLPLGESVRFSVALEAPWAFHYHQTLGLVAYTGLAFRF
jgi:hypothetical protein